MSGLQIFNAHPALYWGVRVELVSSFADIGGGRGGYWEDRGYEWYAGI